MAWLRPASASQASPAPNAARRHSAKREATLHRNRFHWLFVLGLLAACSEAPQGPRYAGAGAASPHDGGNLTFYHSSNVRSLDPHLAYDELSIIAIRLLFDGLLDYDAAGRLIPSLAESMPEVTEEGRTFRFRLRPGVRFHHGRELTAEDVRWSLERMLSADLGSAGVTFFEHLRGIEAYRQKRAPHIEGIRVLGRYVIELRLQRPDQTFLYAMAMPFAYPLPAEKIAASPHRQVPVGTGPFRLQEWERGVRLVFTRFERYWRPGLPHLQRLTYLENVGRDVATMRFRNGDVDHTHQFSLPDRLFFMRSAAWRPYSAHYTEANIWGLALNCGMFPFDNVHLRRAVAAAIDRRRWSRARNGLLNVTGQALPPMIAGHADDLPDRQQYDLALARREMRLAGYPKGIAEEITLWLNEGSSAQLYGELVQEDLRHIGLRIRLKPVSFPIFIEQTGKPGQAQMSMSGWAKDFPDAASFLDILFHSRAIHPRNSENRSFYRNAAVDALLDAARIEPVVSRRTALYRQASSLISREAPWAFVWNDRSLEVWQPYLRGYRPHPVWRYDMRFAWLDLPRRRAP